MSLRASPPAAAAVAPAAGYGPARLAQVLEAGTAGSKARKVLGMAGKTTRKEQPPPPNVPKPIEEVRPHVETISEAERDEIARKFAELDAKYPGWSAVFFRMTNARMVNGSVKFSPRTMDPRAELAKMVKRDKMYTEQKMSFWKAGDPQGEFFKHFREQYRLTIEEQERQGEFRALVAWSNMSGISGRDNADNEYLKLALQLCAGGDFDFDPYLMHPAFDWKALLNEFYRFPSV